MPAKFEINMDEDGRKLAALRLDPNTGQYVYPPVMGLPPLSKAQYDNLMAEWNNKTVLDGGLPAKYAQLKQDLLAEARKMGDDGNRFDFDDRFCRIGINYGQKEFLDTFPEGKVKVREAVGGDPTKTFQELFRTKLSTPQQQADYAALKDQALDDFRTQGYKEVTGTPDISGANTAAQAFTSVAGAAPGMCLDDDHGKTDAKDALVDNMQALKAAGIKTLYIEHFWQDQQKLIDTYLSGPANAPMPPPLDEALKKLDAKTLPNGQPDPNGKTEHRNILTSAKQNGMRIVGLEDFNAKTVGQQDPRNWEHRAGRFNKTAQDVIRADQQNNPGKFVLFAGEEHNNTHTGGIPGLSQLLGIPALHVNGGKLAVSPEDKSRRGLRSKKEELLLDRFIDQFMVRAPGSDPQTVLKSADKFVRGLGPQLDRYTDQQVAVLGDNRATTIADRLTAMSAQISTSSDADLLDGAFNVSLKRKEEAFLDRFVAEYMTQMPGSDARIVLASAKKLTSGFAPTLALLSGKQITELADNRATKTADKLKQLASNNRPSLDDALDVGCTPLQAYARQNDLAKVQEMLAAGANANEKDAKGNTALHKLVVDGNLDIDAVSGALLQAGASLAEKNQENITPLHQALRLKYDSAPPFLKWMANHKADFQKAANIKRGGMRPVDMIIARGDVALENAMYDQGFAKDGPLVTLAPGQKISVPEILAKATVYEDDSLKAGMEENYKRLYEDYPELRSTMEFTAMSALGNRRNNKAMRLVMAKGDTPSEITTDGGYGAYNSRNDTVALGAGRDPEVLKGTLIHEFTHFTVNKLFNNNAQPFTSNNQQEEADYQTAINEASTHDYMGFGAKDREFREVLTTRLAGYAGKPNGRVNLNQEGIVGIPQLFVLQGRAALEGRGDKMVKQWEQFRDRADVSVAQNPLKAKLAAPTTTGQPYKALNTWADKGSYGTPDGNDNPSIDAQKLASAIMQEARVKNGNFNDMGKAIGCPMASSGAYKFEQEVMLDIFQDKHRSRAGVKEYLNATVLNNGAYSKPGPAAPLVQRARVLLNDADNLSDDELIRRAEAIGDDGKTEFTNSRPFVRRMNKLEASLAKTIDSRMHEDNLPADVFPEVLEALVRKAGAKVGAGMKALEKTSDNPTDDEVNGALKDFLKDFQKDADEVVSLLKTAASRKKDIDARATKIAAGRHKITNGLPISDEEFAEAVVLEAQARYHRQNPPANGLPAEVDASKQRDLISKLAKTVAAKKGKGSKDFDTYTTFVMDKVLYTKGDKLIGKRDQSHISIASRKEWVKKLGQL